MADDENLEIPGLTPQERELLKKLFGSPLDFPTKYLDWLVKYIEANPPVLPISQIFGFTQFQARFEQITGGASTATGNVYVDLTGPELTELPKGQYILMYGCKFSNTANQSHNLISVSVNGAAASDADSGWFENGPSPAPNLTGSVMRATLKDLDLDSNSVDVHYKQIGGATMTVEYRWLIAIKIANL